MLTDKLEISENSPMSQKLRKVTYTNYAISVKRHIIGPGLLNVVGDLPDYFLLLFYVSRSELGEVPFQQAHMFSCQCDLLAKYAFLF